MALLVIGATVMGQVQAVAAPTLGTINNPAPVPDSPDGPSVPDVFELQPKFPPKQADPAQRRFTPTAVVWPRAASGTIELLGPEVRGSEGVKSRHAGLPVWVQAKDAAALPSAAVDVRVLDQAAAQRAGVRGLLLTVQGRGIGRVRLGVDYQEFAQAYGGNFGSRLRLVRLPACAVSTPEVAACRKPEPLAAGQNDLVAQTASAEVAFSRGGVATDGRIAAAAPTVLALAAGTGEDGAAGGSYAATELKPSGSWSGGGSTGGFGYSYPITMPPAASSLVPEVALSYSSSGIDGQTASTQAQANWVGDGWSTPESYIEQTFVSCSDDPRGTPSPKKTSDQCYNGEILTISLLGRSSALVWDAGAEVWKAEDDNGEVIRKVTGSNNGSGTYNTSYWTVTTRDGAVFMFGRNQLPGWTQNKPVTNSVDTVPVYSPHDGDPCYSSAGFDQSVCTMAYRWNLDYVKDSRGNAMAYYYQQNVNHYGRNQGASDVSYVRDSYLARIDYGFTDNNAYSTVPNQVLFGTGPRCVSGACTPLSASTKANWPDVPFDLICAENTDCNTWSPGFFSTVRLTSITTRQWSTAISQYVTVDSYALTQTIPPTGDGTSPTLWLSSIQRTGHDLSAGGSTEPITLPPVTFGSVQLPNRVATAGLPEFYRYRILSVTSESGSKATITYELTNPCTSTSGLNPATNTSSCYPVRWTPPAFTTPIVDWFNKYVVTKVTETDPTGGAADLTTNYRYLGGLAWHYDENEVVKAKHRTYGQFRGYGKVQKLVGDIDNDRRTLSETVYYRGMSKNNSATVVNLQDSQNGLHEDHDKLAGRELETTLYRGEGGDVDHSVITSYWISGATATRTRTGLPALQATMSAVAETFTRQAVTSGASPTWRYTQTDNSYDATTTSATFGLLKHTYTHTVPVDAAYDSCTSYTYAAPNTGRNIVGLASQVETVSVACKGFTQADPASAPAALNTLSAPTTVSRPAQVVSHVRNYYDDENWVVTFPQAAAPSKGNVTMVRKAVDHVGGAYSYRTVMRAKFDGYGRAVEAYDGNGGKTLTSYTMNSVGLSTAITITNPLNQSTTTTLTTARALTKTINDINNVVTTTQYDAIGRAKAIWLAGRATSVPASHKYTYAIDNAGYSWSSTQKLNDSGGYLTSTLIYDALLRPRQTQAMTPQGGRLVKDNFYDSRGWVSATYNNWWDDDNTPSTSLASATGLGKEVHDQNFLYYDGLGRQIEDVKAKLGVAKSSTRTVHHGDRTTVVPPTGGTVKTTFVDPLGRASRVEEYVTAPTVTAPGDTFTGVFQISGGTAVSSMFGYDGHGLQSTITDDDGKIRATTYNLLGQATSKTDPDGGQLTGLLYDGNGNLVQSTDARGKVISLKYDQLNRKTGMFASTEATQTATNQLAAWVYDNSDNAVPNMPYAIGKQTSSTAFRNGAAYKIQQTAFNIFGSSRGVTVTIPAVEGSQLGTTYTFNKVYSTNTGLLLKDVYPAKGGLPSETVNHAYAGAFDLPDTLGGVSGSYVDGVTYDAWGRVDQQKLGAEPNLGVVTHTYDPHTGRLTDKVVTRQVGTPSTVDAQHWDYDLAGNVIKQVNTRLGATATAETQCTKLDGLRRMVAAWTATDGCAVTPSAGNNTMVGSGVGAASAYWTTWTVDDVGNRRQQVQRAFTGGPASNTTTEYGYGTGTAQPNTLTSTTTGGGTTGTTSYTYDSAGNMLTRSAGNGNQMFHWNEAGQLTSITGGGTGTTDYIHDADGNLLLQKDPGFTTLYLPGQQLVLNTTSLVVTGTRYYDLPGGGTCIRTGAGTGYSYAVTDQHGTPMLYLSPTMSSATWRQYTPFGADRGLAGSYADNRGFLNKVNNNNTGLTQVGVRNYDAATGRFISRDPMFVADRPQSWNGYAYANNNPFSFNDASGMWWADLIKELKAALKKAAEEAEKNNKRCFPSCEKRAPAPIILDTTDPNSHPENLEKPRADNTQGFMDILACALWGGSGACPVSSPYTVRSTEGGWQEGWFADSEPLGLRVLQPGEKDAEVEVANLTTETVQGSVNVAVEAAKKIGLVIGGEFTYSNANTFETRQKGVVADGDKIARAYFVPVVRVQYVKNEYLDPDGNVVHTEWTFNTQHTGGYTFIQEPRK